jgi:hypothetical protein
MDLDVKGQVNIPIVYDSIESSEGLRLDLLVADCNSIEVKVVELLTCLGCSNHKPFELLTKDLGSSINKNDIKRFVNTKKLLKL